MFEFNPKLLLFIPVTVVFYKLLSQKEEVNEEPYPYFEYQKKFQRSLKELNFEKPRLPNRKLKTRKKLFKIMDDSIKNREVKEILNNIIDKVVENCEKEKKQVEEKEEKEEKEKKNNVSYLSYFNISRFISRNDEKFEKVDLSSDGSYDKVSDISKFSDFSKISKMSEFSKIDEEIK